MAPSNSTMFKTWLFPLLALGFAAACGGSVQMGSSEPDADTEAPSDDGDTDSSDDGDTDFDGGDLRSVENCQEIFTDTPGKRGFTFYRLASSGGGLLAGAYDGHVCAYSHGGSPQWTASTGGFVFDVDRSAGLAVAANADGKVYAFDADDGALRWEEDLGGPVYQARIATLGDRVVVLAGGVSRQLKMLAGSDGSVLASRDIGGVITRIRVGNVAGDAAPEIVVLSTTYDSNPRKISIFGLEPGAPVTLTVKVSPSNNEMLDGGLFDFQLVDMDQPADGRDELVTPRGAFRFRPGLAPSALEVNPYVTFANRTPKQTYDFTYTMQMVAVGNFTAASGLEVAVLDGPDLSLYRHDGTFIATERAPQGFTDIVALRAEDRGMALSPVVLGSAPNGDNQLYLFDLSAADWRSTFTTLPRRGRAAEMANNNLAMLDELKKRPKSPETPLRGQKGPFTVTLNHNILNDPDTLTGQLSNSIDVTRAFASAPELVGTNLRFASVVWAFEAGGLTRPDGALWKADRRYDPYQLSKANLFAIADRFKAADIFFFVQVGHGCDPYLAANTALAMCERAPDQCMGFVTAEDEGQDEDVEYYFEHFLRPILSGIAGMTRGPSQPQPVLILREKAAFWATTAASPAVRAVLFPPGNPYKSIVVPSVEDSNSRSPDLNMAARLGLWRDGLVERWASRMTADDFSFNRMFEWEYPMAGHPHLRFLSAHASLGASIFMLFFGQGTPDDPSRVGREGALPFLHLLGRGIIEPPTREQLVSLLPVGVRITTPLAAKYRDDANTGHVVNGYDASDLAPGAFTRLACYWGMAPTPPTDLSSYLWGRTRQFGNFIPATPNGGFVSVLPAPVRDAAAWDRVWSTNGIAIEDADGDTVAPAAAKTALLADVATATRALPFKIQGTVFSATNHISTTRVVLTLIDPDYLDPRGAVVRIAANPGSGSGWDVRDRVTDKALGRLGDGLSITVDPGSLRVLELTR